MYQYDIIFSLFDRQLQFLALQIKDIKILLDFGLIYGGIPRDL